MISAFKLLLRTAFFSLGLFSVVATASAANVQNGLIKSNAIETEHFQIEFSDLIAAQDDSDRNGLPDVVDLTAEVAEYSYDVEIGDLNYPDPMADSEDLLLLILDDNDQYLIPGALGVTTTLSNGDPYMAIDPFMSEDYIRVTVAHEFFHAIQFGMSETFAYTYQGMNLAESTAVWMEDQVYPDINDFANYLGDFFAYPDYSVFSVYIPEDSLFQYALNVWPRFLAEEYGSDVIRDVWMEYVDSDMSYASDLRVYEATRRAIAANGGDLLETFQKFTLWNLNPESYQDAELFPAVDVLPVTDAEEYQTVDALEYPTIFGTNYLYFANEDRQSKFYFHFVKPQGVAFSLTLLPARGGEAVLADAETIVLDEEESMDEVFEMTSLSAVQGVYVVVSPVGADFAGLSDLNFDTPYAYSFFGNFTNAAQDYSSLLESADSVDLDADTEKDVEAPSPQDDVRSLGDQPLLQLIEYDEDSAYFSWTRPQVDGVAGYVLVYLIAGEEDYYSLYMDRPFKQTASIHELQEGASYYFLVQAVDAEGNGVGEISEPIVMVPTEWIFDDLSYMNVHFTAIQSLTESGVFSGYPDGTFKPNQSVNRAELLKILMEARGLTPSVSEYKGCFSDVGEEWFAPYICMAKEEGWIKGYADGTFKPSQGVSKVEALKILFQVNEQGLIEGQEVAELPYPDLGLHEWYSIYVWKASKMGLLDEARGQNFDPSLARSRGQIAEEVYRFTERVRE